MTLNREAAIATASRVSLLKLASCQLNDFWVMRRSTDAAMTGLPCPYTRLANRITVCTKDRCMMTLEDWNLSNRF